MSIHRYEEAFQALQTGNYRLAIDLFEPAARDTGYQSDIINHAFTLALYHAGEKSRLAEVGFRVGQRLVENDPASAMDYFQRALFAGLDGERVERIGATFETWAAPADPARVTSADSTSVVGDGNDPPHPRWPAKIRRVAHVVGCLLPGHAPSVYVRSVVAGLKTAGVSSAVFTTEWASSWFFNPEGIPQSRPQELPPMDAEVHVGAVGGDFLERADRIAQSILRSGCDAALFHASLTEQITARVAAFRPAPILINVNHGSEMNADLFDGAVHLFRNALERTRFPDRPSRWIPLVSDIETRLDDASRTPIRRSEFGEARTLSATFGNLYKISGEDYLGALAEILRRFPSHMHLFAGSGDARQARSYLHSKNVLSQVRFLGHLADVAQLLPLVDVYIASFPHSGGHSVLEAMGAGKPVVVRGYPSSSHYNSGAELVELEELIARTPVDFVDIADRLIRDADYRHVVGQAVRHRFRQEFRPDMLGPRYLDFFEEILAAER